MNYGFIRATKNFRIMCSNPYAEYLFENMIEFATVAGVFFDVFPTLNAVLFVENSLACQHMSLVCHLRNLQSNLHPSYSCGIVYLQLCLYPYLYLCLRQSICKYLYYLCSANIVANQSNTNDMPHVICYALSAFVSDGYIGCACRTAMGMYLRSRVFRCK